MRRWNKGGFYCFGPNKTERPNGGEKEKRGMEREGTALESVRSIAGY